MCPSILLVDVASSDRESWKTFLQNQSFEVFTAEDGDTALRQCLLAQPDLVLLYDSLPAIDGFELCRRFKDNPLNHLVRIVLIKPPLHSAHSSPGRLAGAGDFW